MSQNQDRRGGEKREKPADGQGIHKSYSVVGDRGTCFRRSLIGLYEVTYERAFPPKSAAR